MKAALLLTVLCLLGPRPARCESLFRQLLGWGGGDPAVVVPAAAETGFTDIAVWNHDPAYLARLVAEANRHHLKTYSCIWLGDQKAWRRYFPEAEPPLQVVSAEEEEAARAIAAELKAGASSYQYGGEPVRAGLEVFTDDLLCPHDPRVTELFRRQIKDLLAVDGLSGIAFDYFGYRNYHGCRCPTSAAAQAAWQAQHPNVPASEVASRFALDSLVGLCNELADEARRIRPGALVTGHVYPVFLPEPLYGRLLRWDTVGETGAWFFEPFWTESKIRAYAEVIAGRGAPYRPGAEGAALIGIYVKPGRFPVKGAERVERELRAIRAGGVENVQVCSLNDVLGDPSLRALFKRLQRGSGAQ